ncbi:MAG: pyridoxamine 5'-phosphate oxidase family protein [Asticcacaulis sp.]|uniref:pyridoxamine 5'-phosphate oxidase family protein n=1 Tax=Asticcacaulis sp. TaxID=1872648 RepID=UPI003F7C01DE
MMDTIYGDEARTRIWKLIKDIKVAQLATFDETGRIFHARPMMALNPKKDDGFDGILWFFTSADSRKAEEVQAHPMALLTYADPDKQSYVSISGQAMIEHDKAKIDAYWTDMARAWFPEGRDDPNLRLLRFDADTAEFIDSPGVLATGMAYLKAMMGGQAPDIGEQGRVDLH